MKFYTKLEAIQYLLERHNDFPLNEWFEAGMWHAVKKVMMIKKYNISKEDLEKLLKEAEDN